MNDKSHCDDFDYEFNHENEGEHLLCPLREAIPLCLAFPISIIIGGHKECVNENSE